MYILIKWHVFRSHKAQWLRNTTEHNVKEDLDQNVYESFRATIEYSKNWNN